MQQIVISSETGKPLYASIEVAASGVLLGAWVGERSIWWVEAKPEETQLSRKLIFRIWEAVNIGWNVRVRFWNKFSKMQTILFSLLL